MKHGRNSQLVPVILIVVIVVISVAAIVAFVRTVMGGDSQNSSQQTKTQQEEAEEALLSTSLDRAVRMTVRGGITADESFRSYQMTISPNKRSMTTYKGYLDQPQDNLNLDNNTKAYEECVFALNRADMMKGDPLTGNADDTRGICANGKVMEFEILQNERTVKRLWTTTCRNIRGSFKAKADYISELFLQQIPESRKLIKKINIRNGESSSSQLRGLF